MGVCVYIYVMYMHIYIYMYMYACVGVTPSIYVYIYIYIIGWTHTTLADYSRLYPPYRNAGESEGGEGDDGSFSANDRTAGILFLNFHTAYSHTTYEYPPRLRVLVRVCVCLC